MDLSGGIFALLGALIGGFFTYRAASGAARLQARGEAFDAFEEVERHWNLTNVAPSGDEGLDVYRSADKFHRSKKRVMFLAGVPIALVDAYRGVRREAFGWDRDGLGTSDVLFEYEGALRVAIGAYLEHPLLARLTLRYLRLWPHRRKYKRVLGHAPAI